MPVLKITKRTVDAATAADGKRAFFYDGDLSGFGLAVMPSGTKSYFIEYRAGSGRRAPTRRLTIGRTDRLTPDEARKIARKSLADVAHGKDPAAQRAKERREDTIEELADRFKREYIDVFQKPSTAAEVRRLVDRVILPEFGKSKISAVKRADVSRWHQKLGASPYAANRALAAFRKMMNLAVKQWELRDDNPAAAVLPFPERRRERLARCHVGNARREHASARERPNDPPSGGGLRHVGPRQRASAGSGRRARQWPQVADMDGPATSR